MHRSFGIDVLLCPHCGSRRTLLALIQDPAVIQKILAHLDVDTEPPLVTPARSPPFAEVPA